MGDDIFKPNELHYFSAADGQQEVLDILNGTPRFDECLARDVLFHKHLLVPDIFFFISIGLAKHLRIFEDNFTPTTLFEEAVSLGIIVPSFRSKSCKSFAEALDIIVNKDKIKGVLNRSGKIAKRLDIALDKRKADVAENIVSEYNKDLAPGFEQSVNIYFGSAKAPALDFHSPLVTPRYSNIWINSDVERWRIKLVKDARKKTEEAGDTGLRRGELIAALCEDLKLPGDALMARTWQRGKKGNEAILAEINKKREEIISYLTWICQIYEYNQAKCLNSLPTLPAIGRYGSPLLESLQSDLVSIDRSRLNKKEYIELTNSHLLRQDIQLPNLNLLSNVSPSKWLKMRKYLGKEYFEALDDWLDSDSSNDKTLRKYLNLYANNIEKEVNKTYNIGSSLLEFVACKAPKFTIPLFWVGAFSFLAPDEYIKLLGGLTLIEPARETAYYYLRYKRPYTARVEFRKEISNASITLK